MSRAPRFPSEFLTDPDARVTPNKDGGFAPNYTPLATVDVESGMIVGDDVIPTTSEHQHLVEAIDGVREDFGLEEYPPAALADGLTPTGDNLAALRERTVTLYAPLSEQENAAHREDPRQPVPHGPLAVRRLLWGYLDSWLNHSLVLPSHPIGTSNWRLNFTAPISSFLYLLSDS